MKINNVIKKTRSVREYKNKKIDKNLINDLLKDFMNQRILVDDIKIDFKFIQDGKELFKKLDGLVGYYGKLIESPHYIYIASEVKEGYLENAGYIGEKIVLKATDLGLGTCWIEVSENIDKVKDILNISKNQDVIGLLAIGYPKKESKVGGMYDSKGKSASPLTEFGYPNIDVKYKDAPVSERISIENIAFLKEWGKKATVEDLENRGMAEAFYYMRLAPSWGNRQPWKFIIDGGKIILAVCKDKMVSERVAKLEAGIAMLYFELMIHESGIPGGWLVEKPKEKYNIPENYFVAGYYKI